MSAIAIAAVVTVPVNVGEAERTTDPDPVDEVTPVPPLATSSFPPRVIAPVVAVAGVNPVVPPLKEFTVAAEVQVVPLDVMTLPDVPGARPNTAPVPFPINAAFAVRVEAPVPPFATFN